MKTNGSIGILKWYLSKVRSLSESIIRMNWFEVIFFIGFGLLYFLFTLLLNIFFGWNQWQGCLFWTFVGVEVLLLLRFFVFPIFKLLKLQRELITMRLQLLLEVTSMSMIVWLIFSNCQIRVRATFLNYFIDRSKTLWQIPFGNAINFKSNSKYLPFALFHFAYSGFLCIWDNAVISQSLNRVVILTISFASRTF
jgi:hypothetical protein